MANTDEETIEQIKRWWKENSLAIILGLVLGLSAVLGWRFWDGHQERTATQASDIYHSLQVAVVRQPELARAQAELLIADYRRTPYAMLAHLELAALAVRENDLARAEEHLETVMLNSRYPEQQALARVRLAQVQLASENPQRTLEVLSADLPAAFASLADELRGDAHRLLGDLPAARAAYARAIASAAGVSDYLQMKHDALGQFDDTP